MTTLLVYQSNTAAQHLINRIVFGPVILLRATNKKIVIDIY
jgi:hypothetical protein